MTDKEKAKTDFIALCAEQEPRIGHWIKETLVIPLSDAAKDCYRCNNCNLHFDCTSKFCPNCGAKMGDQRYKGSDNI